MIRSTGGVFESYIVMAFRKDEIRIEGSRFMDNMFISGGFEDALMIGSGGWDSGYL